MQRVLKWEGIAEHKLDHENGHMCSMQWTSDGSGLYLAQSGGPHVVLLPDLPLPEQRLDLSIAARSHDSIGRCSSCQTCTQRRYFDLSQCIVPRLPDDEATSIAELPTTAASPALREVLGQQTHTVGGAPHPPYHLLACSNPPSVSLTLDGGFAAARLALPPHFQPQQVAAGACLHSPLAVSATAGHTHQVLAFPGSTQELSKLAELCSVFNRDCSWLLAHAKGAAGFAGKAWTRGMEPLHDSLDALEDIMGKQGLSHAVLGDTQLGLLADGTVPVLGRTVTELLALPSQPGVDSTATIPHSGTLRHLLHAVAMGLPQLPGRLGLVQWLEGASLGTLTSAAVESTALVQFSLQQHVTPVLLWVDTALGQLLGAVVSHVCDPASLGLVGSATQQLEEARATLHTALNTVLSATETSEIALEVITSHVRVAEWAQACATSKPGESDEGGAEKAEAPPAPGRPPLDAEHLEMLFHLAGSAAPTVAAVPPVEESANPFGIVFGASEGGGAAVAAPQSKTADEDLEGGVHSKRLDPLLPCSVAAQCSGSHPASVHSLLAQLAKQLSVACEGIVDGLCRVQGACLLQLDMPADMPLSLAVAPPVPEDEDDEDEQDEDEGGGDDDEVEASPDAGGGISTSSASSIEATDPGDEVYVATALQFTPSEADRPPSNVLVVWRLPGAAAGAQGAAPGHAAGVELPPSSHVLACHAFCAPSGGVRLLVVLRTPSPAPELDEGGGGEHGDPPMTVYAAVLNCADLSYWPLVAAGNDSPRIISSVNDIVVLDDEAPAAEEGGADTPPQLSLGKAGVYEWGDVVEHCSEQLDGWPDAASSPCVALSASRGLAIVRCSSEEGPFPFWVLDIACDSEEEEEDGSDFSEQSGDGGDSE